MYRMAVKDEIDFDIRTFSYGNIGRSRHTGLELEGSRRVASWFQPSVEYALTRVTDAESDLQLEERPSPYIRRGDDVGSAAPGGVCAIPARDRRFLRRRQSSAHPRTFDRGL